MGTVPEQDDTMPKNSSAARREQARALAAAENISYTAALRRLDATQAAENAPDDDPDAVVRKSKQAIRARMAAIGEPYTVAARAISSRFGETGDPFLADRRADLDAGEDGAGMTDADYYDRISVSTEPITYCAECGQATDGRCVYCHRRVCLDCSEGVHQCPGLDG